MNQDGSVRLIEMYQDNSFSISDIFYYIDCLVEANIKNIVNLYSAIFNIQREVMYASGYIKKLYSEIMTLKKQNIPINKKMMKLFILIQSNVSDKTNQTLIVDLYQKFLNIIL